ncbi:ComF family protein [Streptomyces sp. KAU_LT]|uniref:ComF family protein n=1 Tax=Streptomyces sp. KAU_LT TaxID=3046669 RepID=UPI0024B721DE|nr:ComF family protein [Streptomyces sp. KAU_LT]MDI9836472.1 ComF family protein [Streptomyces sp. KAU_LT]
MRGWWQDLTDLVLPAECGGCGKPRTVLCPECRAVLTGTAPSRVRPVPEPPGLPEVHAAARYTDEVRAVLLAHKERGALALAAPLGAALARAVRAGSRESRGDCGAGLRESRDDAGGAGASVRAGGDGSVLLVPVPSARAAVRARGHDPARRIALAAAGALRRTGTPARVAAVLRQARGVADQTGLSSRQRLVNLAGALSVVPGGGRLLAGAGSVVLVDDLTTGASLAEAARAVREAVGAGPVGGDLGIRAAGGGFGRTEDGSRAYGGGNEGNGESGDASTAVYRVGSREGRGEDSAGSTEGAVRRTRGTPGIDGRGRAGSTIRAAVIAAAPDSFEINRN